MFDDSAEAVIRRVLHALESAEVPYMLTGSFASAFHGAPRTTQDIDIVIAPTLGSLQRLIQEFPAERHYLSRDAALQAYGSEGLFNVIDFDSGWKIDFIVRKSRSFSVEEFGRRQQADLLGLTLFVASAEDVIVSKLEWAKLGESERQIRDVAGILKTKAEALDYGYIERWVVSLSLETQWKAAKNEARSAAERS